MIVAIITYLIVGFGILWLAAWVIILLLYALAYLMHAYGGFKHR